MLKNSKSMIKLGSGIAFSFILSTFALAADLPVHLRGEITSVTADHIEITGRNGTQTSVALPEQVQVLDVSRTDLSAIKENSYLGIAAAPAPAGKVRALGVMVFPEGARGLNEGHFPWDLGRHGSMTNATVAKLVKKGSKTEMEMQFGSKSQAVILDSGTVFGQFVPGKRELIMLHAKVLIVAQPAADGAPIAQFVMVGRDGFLPPL